MTHIDIALWCVALGLFVSWITLTITCVRDFIKNHNRVVRKIEHATVLMAIAKIKHPERLNIPEEYFTNNGKDTLP